MALHFNMEEVRTLCLELGITYDELGGEGLRGRIREMLLHAHRHSRLPALLAALRRERPAVAWPASIDFVPSGALPAGGVDATVVGGDVVGGNKTQIGHSSRSVIVIGDGASATVNERDD
jgi:hypothetical protein